jgi:hypothetical protein
MEGSYDVLKKAVADNRERWTLQHRGFGGAGGGLKVMATKTQRVAK